jgi:hypothetical protein
MPHSPFLALITPLDGTGSPPTAPPYPSQGPGFPTNPISGPVFPGMPGYLPPGWQPVYPSQGPGFPTNPIAGPGRPPWWGMAQDPGYGKPLLPPGAAPPVEGAPLPPAYPTTGTGTTVAWLPYVGWVEVYVPPGVTVPPPATEPPDGGAHHHA